mgnify:FL=1
MTDHRSGPEDDRARFAEIVAQLQSEPWPDIDDLDQGDGDVERDSEHGSGRASGSDSGRASGEGEGSGDDGRTAGAGAPDETDGADRKSVV